MRTGFIKLHRQILDSEIFADEGTAHTFVMLLLKCNWKPGKFNGHAIKPGQMVFAWRELPERLQGPMVKPLSIGTLRKRLNAMAQLGTIKIENRKRYTLLTIPKWAKYQQGIVSETVSKVDTIRDTIRDTMSDTDIRRKKKVKKNTSSTDVDGVRSSSNGKAEPRKYTAEFEKWWTHYPRKIGKPSASKAFSTALARVRSERRLTDAAAVAWLINQTAAYARSVASVDAKHVKHPGPWLNDDRFNDDYEAETTPTIRFDPRDAI